MMSSVRLRFENWRLITSLDNNLVKLYASPYVPKSKNGIFQKTVIFHFLAVLVCLVYFFFIFQNLLYPRFSEIGMSQNWKWNIPIFQVIPKKWSWVCPNFFLEYPIFQISHTCVCPSFETEYPGIFLEYSNLLTDSKKSNFCMYNCFFKLIYLQCLFIASTASFSKF